jgi:hypothetical protein
MRIKLILTIGEDETPVAGWLLDVLDAKDFRQKALEAFDVDHEYLDAALLTDDE